MEHKLKKLFDYQKFENNSELEALIAETRGRYAKELSDDELEMVSAAGVICKMDAITEIDDGEDKKR